ncbi:MAG: hypothetical protein ACJ8FY_25745 [Gemmataceae bacterium]
MESRRRNGCHRRSVLFWFLLGFLALQAASTVLLDCTCPELYDPEYQRRLATLRTRQDEAPERPLLFVLGSSRTALAFRPEIMPSLRSSPGVTVLPFNFSHYGAGPLFDLMQMRRLLAEGVRPSWLVVEVLPAYFTYDGDAWIMLHAALWDYSLLRGYLPAWRLYGDYLKRRVKLAPRYPAECLCRWQANWVRGGEASPLTAVCPLGGCPLLEKEIDEPARRRRTDAAYEALGRRLARFGITPTAERATRELLQLCQNEGIQVVLVITPEGTEYRSWYPSNAYACFVDWLTELSGSYDVPLVDAHDWLTDADFYDYHHVLERGALRFTRRLTDDVLRPLVQGQPVVGNAAQKKMAGEVARKGS